jgi:hypothetical protein
MLVTTENNENELPPARVLAGLDPDPLPADDNGVFIEEIDPRDTMDIFPGAPNVMASRPALHAGMEPGVLVNNKDMANALNNNQLQLYCALLDNQGDLRVETFDTNNGDGADGGGGGVVPGIALATTITPAIPVFVDGAGVRADNPTMFATTINAAPNKLTIAGVPTGVELKWAGPGTLMESDEITGPFTPVAGDPVSPLTVLTADAKKFYRLMR